MLLDSAKELTDTIRFINLLCRLGVSYHFEPEIYEQLNHIFNKVLDLVGVDDMDLSTLANLFRISRQYGYNMTCDLFMKFKDDDGQFKRDIANDVKGILCLYEACYLALPGEDILDEALSFTRKHLNVLAESASPHMQKHIRHSLMYPFHRTIERFDTLHYILFYEQDESPNGTLLEFAKLDYNRLQLLYKKELALLSRWWENTKIVENLSFGRDRLVEGYLWALGSVFEPEYSISRILICKYVAVLTVMDDTYDSYGTIDELKLLNAALERYTVDKVDELPEYMKFMYKAMMDMTENVGPEACYYKTTFAREMMFELAMAYYMEAVWQKEKKAPSFNEYMKNGKVTSTYDILAAAFILGAENLGMKEIIWVRNDSEMVVGAKYYPRFLNDIDGVRTDETKRGDFPKAVDCYTKEYGVSKDEAVEAILKILENQWKKMNEDLLKPNTVPRIMLKYTFNYARISIFYYQGTDWFTYGHNIRELVTSLFIDPLPM